jgi:hypothetical protein
MKASTPSFIEIELTTALPWRHLRPASMTSHFGGVDHDRHPANVRLGRDKLEEAIHGGNAVDHAFVHVDVDDLSAGLDLLASDRERRVVIACLDEVAEPCRAGDIRALADIDEQRLSSMVSGSKPDNRSGARDLGDGAGRHTFDCACEGGHVLR